MKNEKFTVELGEVTEVRDAETSSPTVEVNIKVNLDGIFLTTMMEKAIAEAFKGNQLFWNEVANIFLGDIGKAFLGLSKGRKNET